MKRLMLPLCWVALTPTGAAAQIELGIDGGLQVQMQTDQETWTSFTVPTGSLRVGFPRERLTIETLVAFQVSHYHDTDAYLALTPGVNLPLGSGGAYMRGEALMMLVSGGNNDGGLGAAIGVKKRIEASPASVRVELGFSRLFDAEVNRLRLVVGLATRIGG